MKKRILTGDRPTGKLHIGHYIGSLSNRVKYQDEYETFLIIADLHVLTTQTDPKKLAETRENVIQMTVDYFSAGINPEKVTVYVQSQIPEVSELSVIFTNLVTVPRAQRVPTLKEVMKDLNIEKPSLGLLNYPVLQTADILCVNAHAVPVGEDQLSHIEVTREIARKFNMLYGEYFNEPEAIVSEVPRLVGLDGSAKMSKSLGNCIYLSDSASELKEKVMDMYTDPNRIHPSDPGTVEGNPVFIYHEAFNSDKEEVANLKERYQKGKVGDVEVKERLFKALDEFLGPIRERRAVFEKDIKGVEEILHEGTKKTREEVKKTLKYVKEAMKLPSF